MLLKERYEYLNSKINLDKEFIDHMKLLWIIIIK